MRFVIWKEFLELRQNPRLFGVVIVAPILQLTMLGYAATTDIRDVPVMVADGDRSPQSRELAARFDGSPYFTVVDTVTTVAEAEPALQRGAAWLVLTIPSGYGRDVARGRPAKVQVVADGTDSNATTIALGYATSLAAGYARELVESNLPTTTAGTSLQAGRLQAPVPIPIEARIRIWFNPQLESRHFMIPGVLALLLLVVTANLSSMAIVRERELGTLEQLSVTPLGRWELILGKLIPYALIGVVDVLLVVAVAVFWFEVPLRGSLALLFALSLLYLVCTLSLGLLVSTISSTQQQAMMTATFFFLVPMIYLSGFIFPIENMPAPIQALTYLIPLRYYLVIVRGIFLKGVGMAVLWPQAAALAGWGAAALALSAARAQKRAN